MAVSSSRRKRAFSISSSARECSALAAAGAWLDAHDMRVPTANLLGHEEGQGFVQLMQQLPQERLQIGGTAIAMAERALALTIDYVKDRGAFGRKVIDFQNTQFKLAELKTEVTIGRVFYNDCVARHVDGGLDPVTAISGAATSIANVGPGLGPIIGPVGTFKPLPDAAKWVMIVTMLTSV